jgi:antitoxin (DNA-binding transcriptional repressor) of toxin-antitoxin stability system
MRSVGLKVLKSRLSAYVRLATNGETVLVTDRDRVVAELVPPRVRSARAADERFADAVRAGWISPAPLAAGGVPPAKPMMAFEVLMDEMRQDRADR